MCHIKGAVCGLVTAINFFSWLKQSSVPYTEKEKDDCKMTGGQRGGTGGGSFGCMPNCFNKKCIGSPLEHKKVPLFLPLIGTVVIV